jgi:hypothetical protein
LEVEKNGEAPLEMIFSFPSIRHIFPLHNRKVVLINKCESNAMVLNMTMHSMARGCALQLAASYSDCEMSLKMQWQMIRLFEAAG